MSTQLVQIYQSEDGRVELEIRLEQETLWLTQAQIADLFQVKPQNITQHLVVPEKFTFRPWSSSLIRT